VYLFQDGRDSTLDISNLNHFFAKKIETYKKLKYEPDIQRVQEQVNRIYKDIRDKVIAPLTIRRTRTDLMHNEAYRKDLITQNVQFPEVKKPYKIFYQLDFVLESLPHK
jgi:hypothetical protein